MKNGKHYYEENLLRTPQDVKVFCNLMNTTPRNATVVVEHNEYTVTDFDEKSFLNALNEWSNK